MMLRPLQGRVLIRSVEPEVKTARRYSKTPAPTARSSSAKMLEKRDISHGFDTQSDLYVDMVKACTIDPAEVVRLALQGAASISGLFVTTEKPQTGEPGTARQHGWDGLLALCPTPGIWDTGERGVYGKAPASSRRGR